MFWNKFEIGSKRSKKEAKNEAEFEDRNIDAKLCSTGEQKSIKDLVCKWYLS